MNILFLGRGQIAKRCLLEMEESDDIKAVVCDSMVKEVVRPLIEVIDITNRNEELILQAIKKHSINILISVQHLWILSPEILNAVRGKAYNLHNAKLPEYKGYNTIQHALRNGEKEYWTTIHIIEPEVDSGDILYERSFPIEEVDTVASIYYKSIPFAVENFRDFMKELYAGGNFPRKKITQAGHFYKKRDSI